MCFALEGYLGKKSFSSCNALKVLFPLWLPSLVLSCFLKSACEYNKAQADAGHLARRKSTGGVIEMLLPASMAHISCIKHAVNKVKQNNKTKPFGALLWGVMQHRNLQS